MWKLYFELFIQILFSSLTHKAEYSQVQIYQGHDTNLKAKWNFSSWQKRKISDIIILHKAITYMLSLQGQQDNWAILLWVIHNLLPYGLSALVFPSCKVPTWIYKVEFPMLHRSVAILRARCLISFTFFLFKNWISLYLYSIFMSRNKVTYL